MKAYNFFWALILIGACNDIKVNKNIQNKQDTTTYVLDMINKEESEYCIKVYLNGKLQSEVYYKDSLKNGPTKFYYKNGKIKYEENYFKGIIQGDAYFYYNNGKIKYYEYYDLKGNLRFRVNYNKKGKICSIEGKSLYIVFKDRKKIDTMSLKDTLSFMVFLASPPETQTMIEVGKINSKMEFIEKKDFSYTGEIPIINYKFNQTGLHRLMIIAKIINDSTVIVSDTVFITVKVIL